MRPQKVIEADILTGLSKVFRAKGYEGASLRDLAEVSGLKKASLYHRFPNGKQEMAESVLAHLDNWVQENVFKLFEEKEETPESRLKAGLTQISTLYDGGKEACIFRALSLQAGIELFEEQVESGMKAWLSAFKKIGIELNLSPKEAKQEALQTLIEIQGSLIVSKGLDDISVFETAIRNIEKRYLRE